MEKLYNSKNFLVRFVHNQRINLIASLVDLNAQNLNILDAGCGEGHLLKKISGKRQNINNYYGIDITDNALEKAKIRCPRAKFYNMDLKNIDFPSECFDVIIVTETLEHIYEYKKVLSELKRVLKKNGLLIITFPNELNWRISRLLLGRNPIKVPDHVNSFTPSKIVKIVNLKKIKQINLPFMLPFCMSLGALIEFKK